MLRNLNPVDIIPFEEGYCFEYRQIMTGLIVAIITAIPLIFLWSDRRMTHVAAQVFIVIFSVLLGAFSFYLLFNVRRLTINQVKQKLIYTKGLILRPYRVELPITALKHLVLTNQKSGDSPEKGFLKWRMYFDIEGLEPFDFYEVNSNDMEAVYGIALKWAEVLHTDVENLSSWEIEGGRYVQTKGL